MRLAAVNSYHTRVVATQYPQLAAYVTPKEVPSDSIIQRMAPGLRALCHEPRTEILRHWKI